MDELAQFYFRHRGFVLSTAYLVACLLFAGFNILYSSRQAWTQHSFSATQFFNAENIALSNKLDLYRKKEKEKLSNESGIRSLPAFLSRINKISNETDVIIQKLTPDPENRLRFTLQIIDNYLKFIKFSSILESLNVNIHNIEVHPYDLGKTPPLHVITFALTPRADAEPLSGERISLLTRKVTAKNKRNPFQRFAFDPTAKKVRPEIDLSWVHRLTGIGRVGDKRYATIDGRDYTVGDKLSGMTIKGIESRRVFLTRETTEGTEKFQLKFRRTKKKKR